MSPLRAIAFCWSIIVPLSIAGASFGVGENSLGYLEVSASLTVLMLMFTEPRE